MSRCILQTPVPATGQSGFTLMEVLIAVTITAVIGLGIWQVISGIITARDRVDAIAVEFNELQRGFLLLERDITQAVNRPVRNVYGDAEPAFTSRGDEFDLLLTRQGWRNPIGLRRSELQRVAYEFTGEELRRRYWQALDQGQDDSSRDQLLISGLKTFTVEYMDSERNWIDSWPTQEAMNSAIDNGVSVLTLPRAVRVSLEHERYGLLERLYVLPTFDREKAQRVVAEQAQESQADDTSGQDEPTQGEPQPGQANP